ncbi:MAG TPA: CRISPR-associated endonuclease Cas2 [Chitinispirillaceae bacterium]|nr:CRISPR-associated endonuclease Cas2 [Chitinispirillaceae bacterium]
MKYVIAFDITDDRIRYKAVKILLEHCYRVQKSVFEGYLSSSTLEQCIKRLNVLIDPKTDSVRYYQLCASCAENVAVSGNTPRIEDIQYTII